MLCKWRLIIILSINLKDSRRKITAIANITLPTFFWSFELTQAHYVHNDPDSQNFNVSPNYSKAIINA